MNVSADEYRERSGKNILEVRLGGSSIPYFGTKAAHSVVGFYNQPPCRYKLLAAGDYPKSVVTGSDHIISPESQCVKGVFAQIGYSGPNTPEDGVRVCWVMTFTRRELFAFAPALLISGCASEPEKKAEPEKPAEPVTGLHALFQMRGMAVGWAPDFQILHYTSIELPEVKSVPGKAAAWQAVLVSPSLMQSRTYTFSVYEASATLHKGLLPESPQHWGGEGKTFGIESARIDTDKAWEVALAHGKEFAAKNPDMPILYTLGFDKGAEPDWRVIWGRSAASSEFSVLVNAVTGEFMQVVH